MFKIIKWLGYGLLVIVLLCLLLLATLRFYPVSVVKALNAFTPYQTSLDSINLELSPLRIVTSNLNVSYQGESLATFEKADFSVNWYGALHGVHKIWQGDFTNGNVNLAGLPEVTSSKPKNEPAGLPKSIKIHSILTSLEGNIENVRYQISDDSFLLIEKLNTHLDDHAKSSSKTNTQNLEMHLKFSDQKKPLHLDGRLSSEINAGVTELSLTLDELNLSQYLEATPEIATTAVNSEQTQAVITVKSDTLEQPTNTSEAPLDWSWMALVKDLNIKLNVKQIRLNENTISDFNADLLFNEQIQVTELSAMPDWAISKDQRFNDTVRLKGMFTPLGRITQGEDVKTELSIETTAAKATINGGVNLNGVANNALQLQLTLIDYPVAIDLEGIDLKQYLPISLNAKINVSDKILDLILDEAQFGKSDFKGTLLINSYQSGAPSYEAMINAKKIYYEQLENPVSDEKSQKEQNKDKLFSKQPIDWQWLTGPEVMLDLTIAELHINDFLFNNVHFPLSLKDKQLSVDDFAVQLGEGLIMSSVVLDKGDDKKPATVTVALTADKVSLADLNLLPEKELTGGIFEVNSKLSAKGDSVHALAASLDGDLFFNLEEAVIQNDSFEAVGSDLVMGIINKLNPFSKSDPSTDLECAVVYASLKNGKVILDNSLGLKTSKIVIAGDGKINLDSEKIDLKLTPKARGGIGINVGSLIKFIKIGGTLTGPAPALDAGGLITSGLAGAAALSTGGMSLVATSMASKVVREDVCKSIRAKSLKQ